MDLILKSAPLGQHLGFEPIPTMYKDLKTKYAQAENCTILDIALSNEEGETSFNYVISNPAYSGIKKRSYDKPNEQDTSITVQMKRLECLFFL